MAEVAKSLVISAKDPDSIMDFNDLLLEIDISLTNLRTLALSINFEKPDERQFYLDNVVALQRFYERAERIALQ